MNHDLNLKAALSATATLVLAISFAAESNAQEKNKTKSAAPPKYSRYLNPATEQELGYCIKISEEEPSRHSAPPDLPTPAEVCLAVAAKKSMIRSNRNNRMQQSSERAQMEMNSPTRNNPDATIAQQNEATAAVFMELLRQAYVATEMDQTTHQVSNFELLGCAPNPFGAGIYCDYHITYNVTGGAGGILDGVGYNNIRERHKGQFIFDTKNKKWREIEFR